jgi:DNA-binding CsgD family transcriptional regulator
LRLHVWRAAIADGWGEPVTGLRADLAVFESAGDDALARICRDLLRQAGVSVRRGRAGSTVAPHLRAVGVTAREAEVLDLVTQGLTNAQVADRLFLSPRTVDHHVARLLAKTGSANRAELGRVVGSVGIRTGRPAADE